MNLFSIVRTIAYCVWTVAGMALWIPFLVRAVMTFNGAMIYATVTRNQGRLVIARGALDNATVFYVLGFRNIRDWTEEQAPVQTSAPMVTGSRKGLLTGFTIELCWAICWWGSVLNHQAMLGMLAEHGQTLIIIALCAVFCVVLVRAYAHAKQSESKDN